MEELLKERFLKAFANTPLNLRDEVILVLDQKAKATGAVFKDTITWRVAYLEVHQDTELGDQILKEMAALDLI
ncbi:hypothetical protein A2635_05620 [Candidatus Peribacteria bacterium RIFCSPHIGHO2_01_FULL_51_9]|nr:MAG: hypothetical protein A2635_05620 [Candidatus Peribacteria bacterium RIFCSPHIGHO2_01_FULL_51_9]